MRYEYNLVLNEATTQNSTYGIQHNITDLFNVYTPQYYRCIQCIYTTILIQYNITLFNVYTTLIYNTILVIYSMYIYIQYDSSIQCVYNTMLLIYSMYIHVQHNITHLFNVLIFIIIYNYCIPQSSQTIHLLYIVDIRLAVKLNI